MYSRMKPTLTVYPCRRRSPSLGSDPEATPFAWITWEGVEREHFSATGSLVADFSQPMEVDASLVKDHYYIPR
ncbi:hypothetical protein DWU99_01895 [Dyella psychrodurans]|uniref:Uncharacterized protein n=2 Tax=Dyella psychrodurans TaxID=1927960 RepID=A0A370XCC2_9GAMM|nr:hypothetical protein DWU99_01895 [Dyella psychrodurans]